MVSLSKLVKRGFSVKFIFGTRVYSVQVSIVLLTLCLTLAAVAAWGGYCWYQCRVSNYKTHIAELEKTNSQYRSALFIKEREREQMVTLAEERFGELCSKLDYQDKKLDKINKVVGSSKHGRHSLKGSRGGVRRNVLNLKLGYRNLIASVDSREGDIAGLRQVAVDYRAKIQRERELAALNRTPSIWPARGEISSDYGWRMHPVLGYGRVHTGLDIAAAYNSPIVATAAGTVESSGWLGGYGNAVTINHGNGVSTLYGHCAVLNVSAGQFVKKGQTIALVGSTGVSTGPHLHYEVLRSGEHTDPLPYLSAR